MEKDNKGYYYFPKLLSFGVVNGISTRRYGNMSFKYGKKEEVERSREHFLFDVGIREKDIATMGLVHGTDVVIVSQGGYYDNVDGLITSQKGLPLFLLTGDCAPIILFDPRYRVLGLVHSGWKGTVGKIALLAAAKMVNIFDCRFSDIVVAFGPTIEKCCYISELPIIQQNLPEWENFLDFCEGKAHIDLNGFTSRQLSSIGVREENILRCLRCTNDYHDEFFCSQRETAGLDYPGRFATVAMIL